VTLIQDSGVSVRTLPQMLALESVGDDVFLSAHPSIDKKWFFGGEVAAQALMAAGRATSSRRRVHSATFQYLRAGDATRRTEYRVVRLRDGGSFSSRAVEAWQGEELLLTASVSFHAVEQSPLQHQVAGDEAACMALPTFEEEYVGDEGFEQWRETVKRDRAVDIVFREPPARAAGMRGIAGPPRQRAWHRSPTWLGPDPLHHAAALTYVSDCLFLSVALGPHALAFGAPSLRYATLNHSIWFHRPARADEWFVYDQMSPWAAGGRGLCHGQIFDTGGALIATTVQEGLLRLRDGQHP
jgi:acyl-CoA thioesterase-2